MLKVNGAHHPGPVPWPILPEISWQWLTHHQHMTHMSLIQAAAFWILCVNPILTSEIKDLHGKCQPFTWYLCFVTTDWIWQAHSYNSYSNGLWKWHRTCLVYQHSACHVSLAQTKRGIQNWKLYIHIRSFLCGKLPDYSYEIRLISTYSEAALKHVRYKRTIYRGKNLISVML